MSTAGTSGPVLVELDEELWSDWRDRIAAWLGNVTMTQSTFRRMAGDTAEKISEPHIKRYLTEIAEEAGRHEQKIDDLYRIIGRQASGGRRLGAAAMSRVQQVMGQLVGKAGGAPRAEWNLLRQLLPVNLDSIGAFSTAQQLGLALGLHEFAESIFPIVRRKEEHQLLIMEFMLEMGPQAILYRGGV
ncbi:hypothetical protein SAMN04489712_14618 [Thermomonospora echinospora]|uniref:Ferritin-like domain-containing protein n=1 Tax=Thermomonospora echinospora TaxID=1992 RepID=A0A1H6EBP8_9ACTN|nr:hypothetical protein [Thermomonospora echinospora]SEG94334.1 hypothetical protein SAMN04489712_14618 [Thermomonospora echinospora]